MRLSDPQSWSEDRDALMTWFIVKYKKSLMTHIYIRMICETGCFFFPFFKVCLAIKRIMFPPHSTK
jgi:hypothetical protein